MGSTKQYLKYCLTGSCSAVASSWSNFVIIEKYGLKGPLCAVGACENVVIWDLRKSEKHMELQNEDKHQVTVIAASEDGSNLAVGYKNGSVKLFDLDTGECLVTFNGHRGPISCLNFDQEGTRVVSGGMDTEIVVWGVMTESGLFRLRGHKGVVTQARFMKNRNILITSSKDKSLKFWDLESQHCFKTNVEALVEIYDFLLIKNDSLLICESSLGYLNVWKISTKENVDDCEPMSKIQKIDFNSTSDLDLLEVVNYGKIDRKGSGRLTSMCQDKSGEIIGSHGTDSKIELFRIISEEKIAKILNKRKKKRLILQQKESEKNGSELTSIDPVERTVDDEIRKVGMFKLSKAIRTFNFVSAKEDTAEIVAMFRCNMFSQCEVQLASNSLKLSDVFNCVDQKLFSRHGHLKEPVSVSFSSDNFAIMSASVESVKVWNRGNLQCFRTIPCDGVTCSIFALEDRSAIVGTKTGKIMIYEISSSELTQTIDAHQRDVNAICLAPNKLGLVSAGRDKHVVFWDFEFADENTYSQISEVKALTLKATRRVQVADEVLCLKYSSDQKYLAIGCLDNKAYIFFADTMKLFHTLYYHHQPITCIDISSDCTIIATGSGDKDIKIWTMDFGECKKILKVAHDDKISSVAFVPKTHLLFSCGKDGKMKQWDCDNFQHILTLEGHQAAVNSISVSSDGQLVASASSDMSVRVWSKTDEILVLSEEREMALEKEEDENIRENILVPGEASQEIGVAGLKTSETLFAADKLCEAIDLYLEEKGKLVEYQKKCQQSNDLPPPPLNILFKSFNVTTPEDYVLKVFKKIKTSDLHESLLILPFSYVLHVVPLLTELLTSGKEVELVHDCLNFLLRVHAGQIISNKLFQTALEQIDKQGKNQLFGVKDLLGCNLAGLKFLRLKLEEKNSISIFSDAVRKHQSKKKSKKALLTIKS